ncbi:MAG: exopolysaccharide biosynthesis protein [Sphingomonas sanxanigenens]|uniref:Exopolysaccharide biosynthesis protein n=1 Tax=Sphingomonas sanxanigenens TaxID=397260 RepID=A0A2W5ABF8_9SPHN|nr:MAG: exopolysaccharide biosynthesis protein [Sphingomonas sanxanigenens]
MTEHGPIRTGSLIERAAEIYDFASFRQAVKPAPDATADRPQPHIASAGVQAIDRDLLRMSGFIVPGEAVSPIAEEFRIAKRQLLIGGMASARDRVILIGSARKGEGKSFCAVNLALSLASERDLEVLLVDGDVAKPSIFSMLGVAGGPGLMDALADPGIAIDDCIVETDIAGLSLLPAGRATHNDTELLASARTASLIAALAEKNLRRLVILDSPPLLDASPASALALHAGQALLVVRADVTSEADLRAAVAMLDPCGEVKLLLNGVSRMVSGQRFGDYYGEVP